VSTPQVKEGKVNIADLTFSSFDISTAIQLFTHCHIHSHKAMLSYLHAMGMHDTYEALKRETENDEFDPSDAKAKWVGLLEKKWTSVIRLQKKVRIFNTLQVPGY
jgi:hypothetical protein